MARDIPWSRRLGVKLGGLTFLLLLLSLALVVGNLYTLSALQGDAAALALYDKGRLYCTELLSAGHRLTSPNDEVRKQARADLEQVKKDIEARFDGLVHGDAVQGVPRLTNPELVQGMNHHRQLWNDQIKGAVQNLLSRTTTTDVEKDLPGLDKLVGEWASALDRGVGSYQAALKGRAQQFQLFLYGFAALVLGAVVVLFWIARSVADRTRILAQTADRIAAGELGLRADVGGNDEVAALGQSFDSMTTNLRTSLEQEKSRRAQVEKLLETIREATQRLTAASSEIVASTTEQATVAQQSAAAVAQSVSTVTEVAQTAEQAAQRARSVGEVVQRTREVGEAGRKVVEDSIGALDAVQTQVSTTAENILALAEQAQAIGDIIATVGDIAEQTNLLALNAAIEASRAGEHGRGFAVVAGEVKALADQSRKATAQVRQILGEVQRATNAAVLSTEEVTRGVAAAAKVAAQAGSTIGALAETLTQAAQAAAQIVASAGQQATGMAQVQQAMSSIDQAARQNLAAMRQAEQAAQDLNALGTRLAALRAE